MLPLRIAITARPLAPVTTILLPIERARVDAAGEGLYRTIHRDTIADVMGDLRGQRAAAVIMSVACCGESELTAVARIVREFPRITAVALLSQVEGDTPQAVLGLGHSGVRALIDVRRPEGWHELRNMLSDQTSADIDRLALSQLSLDLIDAPEDCWRFFAALFDRPHIVTIRALARRLQVLPNTLMSRFFRAGLPSPKRYLAVARLIRAARAFENPGLSVAAVSNQLDYSSPQSFGRHVRNLLGLTGLAFRQRYDGAGMFQRFRAELVLPYLGMLRRFTPLSARSRWSAPVEPASRALPATLQRRIG